MKKIEDYVLYLVIGGLYAFAVNLAILTTTIVQVPLWQLFMIGLGMLVLFAVVLHNRYTLIATLAVVALTALILFWRREYLEDLWYFIYEITSLTRGLISFRAEFTWPIVLGVALLTALFIAICLYVSFHFYMLAAFGAAIFIICWVMDYPQSLIGFIIYLFCFCVFLVRKLQGVKGDGTRAALITAPMCAFVVWFATAVPIPTTTIDSDAINRLFYDPWEVVGEFFFLTFNPMYFSFQTTGFAGHGGRLGGPVSPNHRPVMGVDADRRIYLSGATHNIYTGYAWTSDTAEFVPTFGRIHPSYIEFMETAHALFRETSHLELSGQWNQQLTFFSYLPLSYTDIFVGTNRTGSLFRPMRERGILFDNPNLHHRVLTNYSGDRRLTELIPRHTVYRYNFLDLDYREPHIQEILRGSRPGLYQERLENPEPLIFTVYYDGYDVGYVTLAPFVPERGIVVHQLATGETMPMRTSDVDIEPGTYMMTLNIHDRSAAFHTFLRDDFSAQDGDLEAFDRWIDNYIAVSGGTVEFFGPLSTLSSGTAMLNKKMGIGQDLLLAEHADFVRSRYMSLPDTLPQRVIDLAHDITVGYTTDYDRVRALQEYLIQFRYTLNPSPVPRDRDFVDYFLFDGQEGYCVYYASAMVVMTRAIGIPARYVEGFLLPAERDQETGLFTVTNRNAHAWAEVYFEGFGWLIVETTSPYVHAMYERPFFAAGDIFAAGFMDWHWDYEEYLRQMGLWYLYYMGAWEMDGDFALGDWTPAGIAAQEPVNLWDVALPVAIAVMIAVPSLIAAYLSVWHILRVLRLRRVGRMSPNDMAVYYYKEILRITRYWNYPVLPDETPYEYGQRVRYRFSFVNDSVFIRDLNEMYYRAKYGEFPLTEAEAAFMRDCYYEFVDFVRMVRGPHRLWYIRYVKGVILC